MINEDADKRMTHESTAGPQREEDKWVPELYCTLMTAIGERGMAGPSHDQLSVSDGRVPIERRKIEIVKENVRRKKIGGRPWSRRNIRPKRSTVPLSNKNRPSTAVKTSSPGFDFGIETPLGKAPIPSTSKLFENARSPVYCATSILQGSFSEA